MAAKDPERRKEIARKAGKARARQFTPAYQRWVGAHQPQSARQAAGRKGAAATIARHGYPALQQKIGNQYLTVLERRVVEVFNRWGWQREIDYWIDYRVDTPDTAYFLDFVLPGRRYIEVNGAWVHAQPGKVEKQAKKTSALEALGWRGIWVDEQYTVDPDELAMVLTLWLAETPPAHKQRALYLIDEEIPF